MSKETPPDPSVQFQEWITQWERSVDEFSNRVMGTDEFSRSINQMQTLQLEFQKNFGEMMSRQLATLNMPSRDDVITLSEDLRAIDRRLEHIERSMQRLIDRGDEGKTKSRGPARTKKPPAQDKQA